MNTQTIDCEAIDAEVDRRVNAEFTATNLQYALWDALMDLCEEIIVALSFGGSSADFAEVGRLVENFFLASLENSALIEMGVE